MVSLRSKISKRAFVTISIAIGAAICLILAATFLYPSTTNLFVKNDTSEQVTVATCGSDPATVNPDQSANLYPPSSPTSASCIIYRGESREYIGCLNISKSEFFNGSIVDLSKMNPKESMNKCGG
jgi:hypothetical protein